MLNSEKKHRFCVKVFYDTLYTVSTSVNISVRFTQCPKKIFFIEKKRERHMYDCLVCFKDFISIVIPFVFEEGSLLQTVIW